MSNPKTKIMVTKECVERRNWKINKPNACPIWEGAVNAGWQDVGVYFDHIILKHPDHEYPRAYLLPPRLTRWQEGGRKKKRQPISFDVSKFPSHEVRT